VWCIKILRSVGGNGAIVLGSAQNGSLCLFPAILEDSISQKRNKRVFC
jgi:hypothetical protein